MHALFSRRFVVVVGSSTSQLTKSLMKKKKLAFSHSSQSRHLPSSSFVTRFVPSHVLRSEEINGFFANTLRNTHLKLKPGSLLEARAGFFDPQLPPKPWGFHWLSKTWLVYFLV
ncbi:unnamed protein product [Brassica oleracea var. botrytis]